MEPEDEQEYIVEAILDEKRRGNESVFRVKWQVRLEFPAFKPS